MPVRLTLAYADRLAHERIDLRSQTHSDLITVFSFWKALAKAESVNPGGQLHEWLGVVEQVKSAADRLLDDNSALIREFSGLRQHERFELIFLAAVVSANADGLQNVLRELRSDSVDEHRRKKEAANEQALIEKNEDLFNLHLHFLIGADPLSHVKDFTTKSALVVAEIISSKGMMAREALVFRPEYAEAVSHLFQIWLTSPSSSAKWVSEYLNFGHQNALVSRVSEDVRSVQQALSNWLQPPSEAGARRADAWARYRQSLMELPDLKETMFAEQFGVREVFVQPLARYKVALPDYDIGAIVPDPANVIASLITDRVPGDELILLCGGPGSGKSTLCRVIASELAQNADVHPVFLRLRRFQDGQDIPTFIESHLQRDGIIDKFTDLVDITNLVLILDGFDELVMASRSRLREFFNTLREDLVSGPLRSAKAIVSGRDTLFPNGSGLPTGSHVISLLPFDRPRVTVWGEKWRALHPNTRAQTFQPEAFYDERAENPGFRAPPLHHLVSWPLTLHLVARVHTSGAMDLTQAAQQQVEKAVLYKSIVSETALRQQTQSGGKGRLLPEQMREFIRSISWEMYSTSRDALDYSEGLPILKSIYPNASEVELAELADVAIVNQPELTKGEEGGFEFVHKSFSEYFVAEKLAHFMEKISFKSSEYDSNILTWRMSAKEATADLSSLLSIRIMTVEVQEMLEPMLADFKSFLQMKGNGKLPKVSELIKGLKSKKARIEEITHEYAAGACQSEVRDAARGSRIVNNERDINANFAVGLLALGCALARRLSVWGNKKNSAEFRFQLTGDDLWTLIAVIQAGDVHLDEPLAERCLAPLQIRNGKSAQEVFYPSVPLNLLSGISGVSFPLRGHMQDLVMLAVESMVQASYLMVLATLPESVLRSSRRPEIGLDEDRRTFAEYRYRETRFYPGGFQSEVYGFQRHRVQSGYDTVRRAVYVLQASGILAPEVERKVDEQVELLSYAERVSDELMHYLHRGNIGDLMDVRRLLDRLQELHHRSGGGLPRELLERVDYLIRELIGPG
jgi:hypothetical protein